MLNKLNIKKNLASQNSGRLHVDYAQARDDQYEFECRQRQLQREMRHRERVEKDRLRPLSPPPIVHFTEHEATAVAERIKTDETFHKAVQVRGYNIFFNHSLKLKILSYRF